MAGLKTDEIDWEKVIAIQENKKSTCESSDIEFGHPEPFEFTLCFDVLSYKDNGCQYYRLDAFLPFSFKSSWIKTEQKVWKQYALKRLESVLESKYNAIRIRDNNLRQKFKEFQDSFPDGDHVKSVFTSDLHHKEDRQKIKGKESKTFGDLRKTLDSKIKTTMTDFEKDYECKLSREALAKMLLHDKCGYCGISIDQILTLSGKSDLHTKRARGYCLEIDQKDPYGFYTDDNCIASCYWCNNAKTDEFSVSEFKEIARGINSVWKMRLGEGNHIEFPEKSFITR